MRTMQLNEEGLRMDLLLLSLLLWSHSRAEVVQSVSDCAEFFLNGNPPQIPGVLENGQNKNQIRYKAICQKYVSEEPRFFTLYDTTYKIPVFSAYIFKGNKPGTARPKDLWMTEPQLENKMISRYGPDLENQASFDDFKNNLGYDKGHLYPSSYGYSQKDKNSTFTLTNVVPQAHTFNTGSWNNMEECVKCFMAKHCIDNNNKIKGFLVTGAEPGNNLLKQKINIPSKMWSAFCCYNSAIKKWFASAHWADNVKETQGKRIKTYTLNELYSKFSTLTTAFKLFSGNKCPADVRVNLYRKAEGYPERNTENTDCNCLPSPSTTAPPTTTITMQTPISASSAPSTTTTTTTAKKTTTSKVTKDPNEPKPNENLGNKILNALRKFVGAIAAGLSGLFGAIAWVFAAIFGGSGGGSGASGGATPMPATTTTTLTPPRTTAPVMTTTAATTIRPTTAPTSGTATSPTTAIINTPTTELETTVNETAPTSITTAATSTAPAKVIKATAARAMFIIIAWICYVLEKFL